MSDPSTTRTLVALSNALDLTTDHLDVSVATLTAFWILLIVSSAFLHPASTCLRAMDGTCSVASTARAREGQCGQKHSVIG